MNTRAQSRPGWRNTRRKPNPALDLNVPAPEALDAETITVNPPQGSVAPIDIEAIEDEVSVLSSSIAFLQARNRPRRRKRSTVVIDDDLEVHAVKPGNSLEINSRNNRRRHSETSRTVIDCEAYSASKSKTKKAMAPTPPPPPPPPPPPKEPTLSCPVCMNELVEACSTICGHVFCPDCIKLSIQKLKKCPTCRKPLTMKSFHRVYLPTSN